MAGQKTISSTHQEFIPPPTPPPSSYDITGTLFPDIVGSYPLTGTFNGQSYYENITNHYVLWFQSIGGSWMITGVLGSELGAKWVKGNAVITGEYYSILPSTGTATVSPGS